jgi:hypothetical protein
MFTNEIAMHIPVQLLLAQEESVGSIASETFYGDFSSDQRFVLTIIGLAGAVFLILILGGVIAGVWSSFKEKQIEADLKRDMLDRGMTPDEIVKVIEAKPRSGFDKWCQSWTKKSPHEL